MKVIKFGGSSLATAERVNNVARIIKDIAARSESVIAVLSAVGGVTDQLLSAAKTAEKDGPLAMQKLEDIRNRHFEVYPDELTDPDVERVLRESVDELKDILRAVSMVRECSDRTLDHILSFGERLNCQLMTRLLKNSGSLASYVDARDLIITEKRRENARVLRDKTIANIQNYFTDNQIYVVTGFISSTEDGITTTLGRGGSDYTAALMGAALNVQEIEIWTDVDGFMSADPRKVGDAFVLPTVSYEEAMELSYFGAKVIHPKTLTPVIRKGIPVRIKNSFSPEKEGTVISAESGDPEHPVKGIASFHGISLINVQGSGMVGVPGIASRLFGALAHQGINIIMIVQASSEHSICFVIRSVEVETALEALKEEFKAERVSGQIDEILVQDNLAIIAAVGENMAGIPGISGKLFEALGQNSINVVAIAQGASERNVSLVVHQDDAELAVNVIHTAFYLSRRVVNLFVVGTGNIGGTLLRQIQEKQNILAYKNGLHIQVCGIANVDGMVINKDGIDLDHWKTLLDQSDKKPDMNELISIIHDLRLQNSILVDVTASDQVASTYADFLSAGIHIVTPNKRANTMGQDYYDELADLTQDHRLHYYYETTVGAGLPLISTIKDLLQSGDQVLKIEGIFSGTLGFIFSKLSADQPFSRIVREAFEKGYTEPDPRDDLSGMDVARKILILAREIGLQMELSQVQIDPPLPDEFNQGSLDEFWKKLPEMDAKFEELRRKSESENKALRYMASLEDGNPKVGIQAVNRQHVLSRADGTDNIIQIVTNRYYDNPMTVQGPGAGLEVTAGGIFANIINLGFHLP
ncbi:MAG: bifunctional aspartate kinase/homoserine dehydrogenase I [candidate division KSB1 bacterium]|nr:bifunctional aspartate kinase/homoserine dehydrogenase I [candidate division KSB1 bacterium]